MQRLRTGTLATVLAVLVLAAAPVIAQQPPRMLVATTLQNAAVANGNGNPMEINALGAAILTVNCATCSGGTTVNFEGSEDGTNYAALLAVQLGTSTVASSTTTAGVTMWEVPVAGLQFVRTRVSAYSAGTVTSTARAVSVPYAVTTVNANAMYAGTAASTGQGVVDSTTPRVFLGQKTTYAGATTAKTATAAGTAPFFAICGSATKTVRVQQLVIGGTVATAAVYGDVELRKVSVATSAGTATALTAVPLDSSNAAATVNLLNFYTALATSGTNVGMIASQSAVFPITGTVAANEASLVFDWTNRQESQAPVLRGTAQCVEASFGTTPANAPTLTVQVIWTEE
jgi:hypothetical protein